MVYRFEVQALCKGSTSLPVYPVMELHAQVLAVHFGRDNNIAVLEHWLFLPA